MARRGKSRDPEAGPARNRDVNIQFIGVAHDDGNEWQLRGMVSPSLSG
jgi:hypothetical protein